MVALLPIFVCGAIVACLLWYAAFRRSRRRMYELAAKIDGLPTLPLIGNAHLYIGTTKDIFSAIKKISDFCHTHDDISKTWIGPTLNIGISNPNDAETVLNAEDTKPAVFRFARDWISNGIITSEVPIWKRHRKLLNPTFNQKILDCYVGVFAEHCETLVEMMAKMVGKGTFDLHKFVGPCTLDIICESAMGTKMDSQRSTLNESYIQAAFREMRLMYQRMFQIWLQPSWMFNMTRYKKQHDDDIKTLHDFTNAIVKRKMLEFKKKQEALKNGTEYIDTNERKAFLDSIIEFTEKGIGWTMENVREQVDSMTIAGYDTTSHTSCFLLSTLAMLPDVQEKVMDEYASRILSPTWVVGFINLSKSRLREIYGDSKRPVIKEDLSKMVYLERVIKETLRRFPIIPVIVRELTKEVKLSKYTLPAGADCVVYIYAIHHDRRIWGDDVEEFNPDRFLPENAAKRNPNTFVAFGGGARNCIGIKFAMMSVKSLVSTVLRNYKLHSDLNYKDIPLMAEAVLKPVNGYLVSIERRTS